MDDEISPEPWIYHPPDRRRHANVLPTGTADGQPWAALARQRTRTKTPVADEALRDMRRPALTVSELLVPRMLRPVEVGAAGRLPTSRHRTTPNR